MEDSERLARRLKRWTPGYDPKQWAKLDEDPHVVTGYFDGLDTFISLLHIVDSKLFPQRSAPGSDPDDLREYELMTLLRDTAAFVSNPRETSTNEGESNEAVRLLRRTDLGKLIEHIEKGDPALGMMVKRLLSLPPLSYLGERAQRMFTRVVEDLGEAVGVGGASSTVFELLESLARLARLLRSNPVDFVIAVLKPYVDSPVVDSLVAHGEDFIRRLVYDALGANRIGCHSLIAKDHDDDMLLGTAMECAKAVDWYVCRTLARHGRDRVAEVGRITRDQRGLHVVADSDWIDWLELLEHFLSNPLAGSAFEEVRVMIPMDRWHVTAGSLGDERSSDTLASLGVRYEATRYRSPGETRGTALPMWEMIADANFPTKGMETAERMRRINAVLRDQGGPLHGSPASDGVNLAFHPGLLLRIPYQSTEVVIQRAKPTDRWWRRVILEGFKEDRQQLGHELRHLDRAQLIEQTKRAQALREELERS